MESIEGILKRTLYPRPGLPPKPSKYSKAGMPFYICALHNGSVVKGEMRKPVPGERYRFYGERRPDRKYPDQETFEFSAYEVLIDERSPDGVAHYLAAHIEGVGSVRAAAIVAHFGDDTLHVLRTDAGRVAEVPGIKPESVESITRHFRDDLKVDPAAYAKLVELFADMRFPRKLVFGLLEDWGSDAPGKIAEDPYVLLAYPRMSWGAVDSFATSRMAYDPAGIARHKAAVVEAMERISGDGHTVAGAVDVHEIVFGLIGTKPSPRAWAELKSEQRIVEVAGNATYPVRFALPKVHRAEREVARRLEALAASARPMTCEVDTAGMNADQVAAVRLLMSHGVCVLAGPPGTGKSWVIARFVRCLLRPKRFGSIRIVCPTGKAAKRAAELLGEDAAIVPCTTIHRALCPTPSDAEEGVPAESARVGRGRDEFGFGHNEDNPLLVDLLIVDETSMTDVLLASALLRALKRGTRVVFVGDPNQLPSVGPGAFLRDLIDAGIPTATLTEIQRSDIGGRIVKACHAMKDGRMPEPSESFDLPAENWVHIEAGDQWEIARTIVELHAKIQAGSKLNLDPVWDMQVVSAQSGRHAFGCANLNDLLSRQLNPPGPDEALAGASEDEESVRPPFRVRDKVIRKKNGLVDKMFQVDPEASSVRPDWSWSERSWVFRETTVVNGDMGMVEDMVPHDRGCWVVVRFRNPDRLCRLSLAECHLIQAYAITVHSAQGSGMPYVIVPVHSAFYWDHKNDTGLWCRELVYTAISRAERILVTVGQLDSIRTAIGRKTVHRRRTMLAEWIRGMSGAGRVSVDLPDEVDEEGDEGGDDGDEMAASPAEVRWSL